MMDSYILYTPARVEPVASALSLCYVYLQARSRGETHHHHMRAGGGGEVRQNVVTLTRVGAAPLGRGSLHYGGTRRWPEWATYLVLQPVFLCSTLS